jgi:hypothetical protein
VRGRFGAPGRRCVANAFIEPGDAAALPVQAELEVSYFDGDDRSGERTASFETPHGTKPGKWATIQAGGVSGTGTRSVSIGLVGIKPFRAEKLGVCFDNVMLKLTHLEP